MTALIGITATFAWLQTVGSSWAARDAALCNGSLAAAGVSAAAFAACSLAALALQRNRALLERAQNSPTFGSTMRIGCLAVSILCGVGALLGPSEDMRSVCFCLHIAATVPLLIAWGIRISRMSFPFTAFLVLASGICSALLRVLSSFILVAPECALPVLPLCMGACLIPQRAIDPEICTASTGMEATLCKPSKEKRDGSLPHTMLFVCLSTCTVAAFIGLTASPFIGNSSAISSHASLIAVAGLALLVAVSFALLKKARAKEGADEGRSALEPIVLVQVLTALSLILAISGLLLYSIVAPGTMIIALAMIVAGGHCLTVTLWAALPHLVRAYPPSPKSLPLMLLAGGTLWAPLLGTWAGATAGLSFSTLTSLSVVTLVIIAAIAIVFAVGSARRGQLAEPQHKESGEREAASYAISLEAPADASAAESGSAAQGDGVDDAHLDLETARATLRAHQVSLMEPYGLTDRERQIVTLLIDGQTMKGIAEELYITERTVKFHCRNAYEKLGVHNKKELMQMFSEL